MPAALVIHENPAIRRKALAALRHGGFEIAEACSAEEAWQELEKSHAELLVAAWNSPRIPGAGLLTRLRAHPAHVQTLVIFLGSDAAAHRAAMDSGADDYLLESAKEAVLAASVRARWTRRHMLLASVERAAGYEPELLGGILFRNRRLGFTHREAEVMCWMIQGKSNPDIGTLLSISVRTVEKHVELIYRKLGVETRIAAVLTASEKVGLLTFGRR